MKKEDLETYLSEKYPSLIQYVHFTRQVIVYDVVLPFEVHWCIDEREGLGCVKDRLLSALNNSKILIEHAIAEVEGTQT